MTGSDGFRRLFRLPPTPGSAARDVDDELQFHLESRVQELVATGRSRDEAEREAAREFGDLRAARAELTAIDRGRLRRAGWAEAWGSWWQDLRFAVRALRRQPGFSAAVLLTLALGVGATGAVFTVADAALLRPLPYAQPDALVHLWRTHTEAPDAKGDFSYPDLLDLRERAGSLAGLAGYHSNRIVLSEGDRPQVLWTGKTSANFFAVLGVRPALGRLFAAGEDAVGAPRVAVLSHALWTRRFAADSGVVGRPVQLDGASYLVLGVLPADFQFAPVGAADVWVPFDRPADWRERRSMSWFRVVARLKSGVTPVVAGRELDGLAATLSREHPRENAESGMRLVPLGDEVTGSVRPLLLTLLGASALVLVVALANVANLLLVRGTARAKELGVRAALGAGRGRLVRQLLTESVLIALLGGALGLVLAGLGVRALLAAIPPERLRGMPYLAELGLGWRLLACTLLVSVVAGVLFGLIPAARVLRPRLADALRQGARGSSEGGSGGRLRDALVAAELGLTVVLLTGAVLFGRSLVRVFAVDPGFRAERVATALVPLPRAAYTSREARAQFFVQLEERARALPGVESVGLTTKLPLDPGNSTSYRVVGAPEPAPGHAPEASFRSVNGDYFRTLGIPLVRGTTFSGRRDSLAAREVIVSAALAREAFGAEDPIGRQLETGVAGRASIVGIVGDVAIGRLEDAARPTFYVPYTQAPDVSMRIAVRTRGDVASVGEAVRRVVQEIDPEVALYQVYTMESLTRQSESVFLRRFPLLLLGAFAVTALLLAVVGTYGVVSYAVAQRVRELGIRIALGASTRSVMTLVVGHVAAIAAVGIGAGLALAVALSRYAEGMLYGVRATDPVTYAGVAALLALVAAAAAAVPARRASRVDPVTALRAD